MFAGLFGTPTRSVSNQEQRGGNNDSESGAPSSQHAADQATSSEAWKLYFDAVAVPETAHTRRWATKVMRHGGF